MGDTAVVKVGKQLWAAFQRHALKLGMLPAELLSRLIERELSSEKKPLPNASSSSGADLSKPAFWELGPSTADTDKRRFEALEVARAQLQARVPGTREWEAAYLRVTRLERALKLKPTIGGAGMPAFDGDKR